MHYVLLNPRQNNIIYIEIKNRQKEIIKKIL